MKRTITIILTVAALSSLVISLICLSQQLELRAMYFLALSAYSFWMAGA